MEISTAAPPSLSLPTGAKSPDTDQAETPTTATAKIHPTKSLPFTNGVLKRHAPPHAPSPAAVSYKECMKNHAASMGAHALDGCGEFMPSPSAVPSDPTSLKCAACGCHRNFHRRHTTDDHHHHNPHPISAAPTTHVIEYHPHHRHHPPPPYTGRSPSSPSPPPISSSYYPSSAPHMLLALSSGGATGGTTIPTSGGGIEPLNSPHGATTSFLHGRKRFRTKFSQDQKDKMHEFAEKLGWKMQKASDEMVAEFCADVGVERGVFKVWMHNNKNTIGKRDLNGNLLPGLPETATHLAAGTASAAATNDLNGSSGNSGNGSHGYSKNGDGTYGSSTSS